MNAPLGVAALRELEMKSAVEMTPRGKRGNSENQKRVFHSFHRAWKSGKTKDAGFPHFHRAGDGLSHFHRTKHEAETKFQLTDHGHFKHDRNASVASLRP
jgi:hypothetical protein